MTDTKLYVVRLKFSRDGVEKNLPIFTALGFNAEQTCTLEALDWGEMFGLVPGPIVKDGQGVVCVVTGDEGSPVVEVRVT
jgi:hypothetical protein